MIVVFKHFILIQRTPKKSVRFHIWEYLLFQCGQSLDKVSTQWINSQKVILMNLLIDELSINECTSTPITSTYLHFRPIKSFHMIVMGLYYKLGIPAWVKCVCVCGWGVVVLFLTKGRPIYLYIYLYYNKAFIYFNNFVIVLGE